MLQNSLASLLRYPHAPAHVRSLAVDFILRRFLSFLLGLTSGEEIRVGGHTPNTLKRAFSLQGGQDFFLFNVFRVWPPTLIFPCMMFWVFSALRISGIP
jgi:hypothetical protein